MGVKKKANVVIFWLKRSIFRPIVKNLHFSNLWATDFLNTRLLGLLVKITLLIVLARVKFVPGELNKLPAEMLICHKLSKVDIYKNSQLLKTESKKFGTNWQSEIGNLLFPEQHTLFWLFFFQRQFRSDPNCLQDQSSSGSNFFGKTPLFFRYSGVNAANAVNLHAKRR